MTDILSVVASGISVASLAIQIADSLNKVISFCESIREAPADVQQLILQLHILTNIVSVIRNMIESGTVPNTLEPTLERALKLVRHDIATLSILSSELDRKLKSERRLVRTWARVQSVFSEKKISLLKSHLESAKRGLNLLQGCIIIEKVSILDSMTRQLPKALGHCWERGGHEDHVTIDDGLGEPMVVPLELCSRPQGLVRVLDIKYSSRILPGLCQVQRGHLAIFDWTQNFKIDAENWESAVKPGGRVKVAFLMSTLYGLSRTKCARCFKPHTQRFSELGFNKCFSCGLEVLRVEPEAITFETSDISIGLSPDQYRNYQLSTRKKKSSAKENNPTSNEPETPNPASKKGNENPPIDLVCKRIVVKWEPMINIVHRYLYCRCPIVPDTT
ncbi:hypothetical protein BKA61DRAFT_284688 [Leptodontidium sp. MPI-SDFR-AT-0119]|nr:hypothetical protein BKA61DRAFT_284688 [Leptodontidium sp. MPI-SDFR-AT-0119]